MAETFAVLLNGNSVHVSSGTTVAAAMLEAGFACRTSVSGEARTALCGMGVCYECRATVDGVLHARTCQMLCREGMRVESAR